VEDVDPDPGPIPVTRADPSWGQPDALVTIVEFGDFQCPYCQKAGQTIAELEKNYGPEQLRFVWKNNPLPFHQAARPAAATAMLLYARLGNDGFWAAYDAFFSGQRELANLVVDALSRAGVTPGNAAQDPWMREAMAKVDADVAEAKRVGATGTPDFFVNGVSIVGAQPYDKFAAVIDGQLEKAKALVAQGTPRRRVYPELTKAQWRLPEPPKPAKDEDDRLVHAVPVGASPVRGKPTALVTIVEFAEFQCPFCAKVETTLAQITAKYGDLVRIVWKHNPLPFHPHAEPAAELAIEARAQRGDKGFWAVHDLLFRQECVGDPSQSDKSACEWHGGTWVDNRTKLDDKDLEGYAKTLGLDVKRVSAAIAGKKHAREIAADQDLADDVGVTGTPHFFINGRHVMGAQPLDRFTAIIDEELAKATALVKGGAPAAQVYERIMAAAAPPKALERKVVAPPTKENPSRGPAGAKVVVQFFGDFQCPFTKRVIGTVDALEKAFPGQIRIVWRNLPLPMHPDAKLAAEAAMEAFRQKGDRAFWAMYELLFAAPPGGLARSALDGYAAQLGLDTRDFATALDTHEHWARIEADSNMANAAGIYGPPAFVINGYFVSGAQSLHTFERTVQRALADLAGPKARP
jgi:protein-disulfide isomerase